MNIDRDLACLLSIEAEGQVVYSVFLPDELQTILVQIEHSFEHRDVVGRSPLSVIQCARKEPAHVPVGVLDHL